MSAAPNTITHPWWTKRVREHDNNKHNNLETNDNATNTDVSYFPARSGSISSIYSSESDTSFISFSELEWSTSDPKKEITTYPTSETSRSTTFEEKLQVEGVVLPAGLLIPLSKVRAVAVTIILAGGVFLHGFTQQAVFILVPLIKRDLSIPSSREGWLTAAYALGFSSFFLLSGRLGDIHGHRSLYLLGTIVVLVATAINTFLSNEWAFLLARGIHGIGAATMVSSLIGVRNSVFASGQRKKHSFITSCMAGPLGNLVGSITAGLIAKYTNSWGLVFLVMSLLALTIIAGIILIIPMGLHRSGSAINAVSSKKNTEDLQDQTSMPVRLDWIGALLWSGGALLLLIAITEAGTSGWQSIWVPVSTIIGFALFMLFFFWEALAEKRESATSSSPCSSSCMILQTGAPLIRLSFFRKDPALLGSMFVIFFLTTAFSGFFNMTTSYFQIYQALDPLDTALRLIPMGVVAFMTIALLTRIIHCISLFSVVATGALALALANLVMAIPLENIPFLSPQTQFSSSSYMLYTYFAYNLPTMVTAAFGLNLVNITLGRFVCSKIAGDDSFEVGATVMVSQLARATGVAITTAVRSAVVLHGTEANGPIPTEQALLQTELKLDGIQSAFWMNSWFAWMGFAIAVMALRKQGPVESNVAWRRLCSN